MRLLADENLHLGIIQGLRREEEILDKAETIVIVLSEAGYRIHKPGGSTE